MSGDRRGGGPPEGWERVGAEAGEAERLQDERRKAARAARNRANARASTGPRTAAGKAASAGNARRHGLAGARAHLGLDAEAAALARRIAGPRAPPAVVAAALAVADALLALRQVRLYRGVLLRLDGAPPERISAAINELSVIDRYEGRARARRKAAIRAFDAAWLEARGGSGRTKPDGPSGQTKPDGRVGQTNPDGPSGRTNPDAAFRPNEPSRDSLAKRTQPDGSSERTPSCEPARSSARPRF